MRHLPNPLARIWEVALPSHTFSGAQRQVPFEDALTIASDGWDAGPIGSASPLGGVADYPTLRTSHALRR